jgi:hypothetical protein
VAARAIPGREQTSASRSKQILGRGTRPTPERRLAACAPSSPCQLTVLSFPSTIRSFHSSITLPRRTALAYAPLLIGPARARIFIEHAMFRPRHQDQYAALLRDLDLTCKAWHT